MEEDDEEMQEMTAKEKAAYNANYSNIKLASVCMKKCNSLDSQDENLSSAVSQCLRKLHNIICTLQ